MYFCSFRMATERVLHKDVLGALKRTVLDRPLKGRFRFELGLVVKARGSFQIDPQASSPFSSFSYLTSDLVSLDGREVYSVVGSQARSRELPSVS